MSDDRTEAPDSVAPSRLPPAPPPRTATSVTPPAEARTDPDRGIGELDYSGRAPDEPLPPPAEAPASTEAPPARRP
jgi:hypothetical protein